MELLKRWNKNSCYTYLEFTSGNKTQVYVKSKKEFTSGNNF